MKWDQSNIEWAERGNHHIKGMDRGARGEIIGSLEELCERDLTVVVLAKLNGSVDSRPTALLLHTTTVYACFGCQIWSTITLRREASWESKEEKTPTRGGSDWSNLHWRSVSPLLSIFNVAPMISSYFIRPCSSMTYTFPSICHIYPGGRVTDHLKDTIAHKQSWEVTQTPADSDPVLAQPAWAWLRLKSPSCGWMLLINMHLA